MTVFRGCKEYAVSAVPPELEAPSQSPTTSFPSGRHRPPCKNAAQTGIAASLGTPLRPPARPSLRSLHFPECAFNEFHRHGYGTATFSRDFNLLLGFNFPESSI